MSKRLDCFIEGCDATVEAETEAEILEQVERHAADAHPDMELDEETVERLSAYIRDV